MEKRKNTKLSNWDIAHDFSALNLTPDNFHAFYVKFSNLRFPIKVAHLLELRYLINNAVDKYLEPPLTPDYRQFRESLQTAVDSFIDYQRHSERMLKILSMLRDIHYAHSVASRDAEQRLRETMTANRNDRMQSIRYGLFFVIASIISGILWLAIPEPSILVKLLPALYASISWYYFHKQPGLDREHERLNLEVNDVLRQRVESLNWKILIHKLALVLGYKRVPGVEVFHIEGDFDHPDGSVYH